jgi:hypothetical protein
MPGRHETVTANAPAKLNGVWTATVMLAPGDKRTLTQQAALVIHEAFHVYQRERHPKWEGNELELFTYPVEDAELLSLRRLETDALRRAEAAVKLKDTACWAGVALNKRRERFALLSEGARTYERVLELNEGLARYVEARAARRSTSDLPANDYPPEEVRLRGYATGRTLAVLLDRLTPPWAKRLEAADTHALDELLSAALPDMPPPCAFPKAFEEAQRARAKNEVASLLARRDVLRREFDSQSGWKIVVNADTNAPLWPQGFDPLNVQRLGASDVLHTRFLKLGNDAGAIEILGGRSLTTGAGAHPLFNGVRQMTLAGLATEPNVQETDGKLTLNAANVKAVFRGARLERAGQTLTVNLQKQEK